MKMTNVRNVDQSIPTENDMICARGVKFQTVYDGVSYNFVCNDSIVPVRENETFTWKNINVQQGQYITGQFIFDNQIKNSKFVLSNARVDKSTLEVSVNSGGTISKFTLSTDVSTIQSSSKVFYTQENEEGFIEIYFGDGVLGQGLVDGDTISATYISVDKPCRKRKTFLTDRPDKWFFKCNNNNYNCIKRWCRERRYRIYQV